MGKIESRSLTWKPQNSKSAVLDNISMELEQGNFYGIIGPNGSGKTSFLKHVMRFIKACEGGIYYDGMNINELKRGTLALEMSFVPQNVFSDTQFSAWDIVMMGRNPHQKRFSPATKEDREIVTYAMESTQCYDYKDKPFSMLSGGEAQRVVCARAVAQDTPWILLDEPVSSLDIKHQVSIMSLLADLNRNKEKSIAAVLHDVNLAAEYCTHIIMMKDGKVFYCGRTQEALTEERLKEVYDIEFSRLQSSDKKSVYFMPMASKFMK